LRSLATVRNIGNLETLRRTFSRIMVNLLPKGNNWPSKSNFRLLQGCGAKHLRLYALLLLTAKSRFVCQQILSS